MKWVSHEVLTGVVVYAATEDPLLTAFSMAGAIFPDKVEGRPGSMFWRSRHRGWSHWPLLYVAAIGALLGAPADAFGAWTGPAREALVFFAAGALLHIAEDALCGKVPLLRPDRKVGLRLFTVGSFREYLVVLLLVALSYVVSVALKGGPYG